MLLLILSGKPTDLFDNQAPHAVADEKYRPLLFLHLESASSPANIVIQFKAFDYIFRFSGALYVYKQFTREAVQTPSSEAKGYLGVIAH